MAQQESSSESSSIAILEHEKQFDVPKKHARYASLHFKPNEDTSIADEKAGCHIFTSNRFMELSKEDKAEFIVIRYISLFFESSYSNIFPTSLITLITLLVGDLSINFVSLSTSTYNALWKIMATGASITSIVLFKNISSRLKAADSDTHKEECEVLLEMEEMNKEMAQLRDNLDQYFLNDEPDVAAFQEEEDELRVQFNSIQEKLLNISSKQNRIHEKLRILHSVERSMIDLKNRYETTMENLTKNKEEVLKQLKQHRREREKAIKIRIAERSYSNWVNAKLNYTISMVRASRIDDEFMNELDVFLSNIQSIAENQNDAVRDLDSMIDDLESHLLSIRHDMSKVKIMTDKKIYDLHKQVDIAESLELGYRRLSVASATEIESEQRHYDKKIKRELITLENQVKIYNYKQHESNLREWEEMKLIMRSKKLKSFFSVFTQTFNQTVCDINLCYENLNCFVIEDDNKSVEYNEDMTDIKSFCMELYGIKNVLQQLGKMNDNNDSSIKQKIIHCMKFIQIAKNALFYEMKKTYINYPTNSCINSTDPDLDMNAQRFDERIFSVDNSVLNEVIIIIGRKLCVDDCEVDIANDIEIPGLSQQKVKKIFEFIIETHDLNEIFYVKPLSSMQIAAAILQNVFDIYMDKGKDIINHNSLFW